MTEDLGKSRQIEYDVDLVEELTLSDRIDKLAAKLALGNLLLQKEHEKSVRVARAELAETVAAIQRLNDAAERYVNDRKQKSVSPPRIASFMLAFIAPKKSVQAFLGDLEEIFQKNVARFGETRARRMYWSEVTGAFGPLLWRWLKRIGFLTMVVDYIRSKLGL